MKNIDCFCDHEKCIICKLRDQYKKRKTKSRDKKDRKDIDDESVQKNN